MEDEVAGGTPQPEDVADQSGGVQPSPQGGGESVESHEQTPVEPDSTPTSGSASPEEPEAAQPAASEPPPSPFGDTSYFPPAAEPVSPGGDASDARVGAAPAQAPGAGSTDAAGGSENWWEQPVPRAAVPVTVPAQPSEPGEAEQEKETDKVSFWRWLSEAAILVALAFAIAFVIKVFVIQPFYIPSGSMEPTLLPGDRVLVNKFIYRMREPKAGDIVVFEAPRDVEKRDFIKRVVAVEGQTVEIKDGKVYVDHKLVDESYLATSRDHSSFGPVTLADNTVFVMGDNRTNSSDSRVFGPFRRDRILGEAFVVYWPFTRWRVL